MAFEGQNNAPFPLWLVTRYSICIVETLFGKLRMRCLPHVHSSISIGLGRHGLTLLVKEGHQLAFSKVIHKKELVARPRKALLLSIST